MCPTPQLPLAICLAALIAGCATPPRNYANPTYVYPSYREGALPTTSARYAVTPRIKPHATAPDILELKTRVTGCQAMYTPRQVVERIELLGPDGTPIQSLQKTPVALGGGTYEGYFIIELPHSIPPGRYRLILEMLIDDQLCARHQANVTRQRRESALPANWAGRI